MFRKFVGAILIGFLAIFALSCTSSVETIYLTPAQAQEDVLAGKDLGRVTITGYLDLSGKTFEGDLILRDTTIEGGLFLSSSTFEGALILRDTTIERGLFLSGATIERGLILRDTTIGGGLFLSGATIERGLILWDTTIEGGLDITTRSGPDAIYVSPEMAERVHRAAPAIRQIEVR